MSKLETLRDLVRALGEERRLRAEVLAWMEAEGREGRLRQNCQAPSWSQYEVTVDRAGALRVRVGDDAAAILAALEGM